jgi:outer membrane receptor protein involved in Fe transport
LDPVRLIVGACVSAALASVTAAQAEDASWLNERVEVTATRVPEPVDDVPASISVVTGEELVARGANDLRTALGLVAGVEGSPGGDGGPAGTVPSLWGLREADAFLLVVDGVPWGGAFNPATASVDLTGVEKIEVLRGAAPVMFGATSFVGVIHVIHYEAGKAPTTVGVAGGMHGTAGASLTANLPPVGDYGQSLALNVEKRGFAEDRTEFRRLHALYRGATHVASARLHVDGDVSIIPQDPSGSYLLRDGDGIHTELPVDANYNPVGAKLDQKRYHLVLGLDGKGGLGDWAATLAVTRTRDDILRGFLRGDAFLAPPDAGVGDGFQADGFTQQRTLTDVYFDAHVTTALAKSINLTYGVDHLHGEGREDAINFGYCIDIAGIEQPCAGAHHADEIVSSNDRRDFSGAYAQTDIKATPTLDVLLGMRLNHTRETASGLAIDNTGPAPVVAFDGSDGRTTTRLSGLAGVSWHAWTEGTNVVTLYADYRNSFKPLAIDFGPEAEVQVLKPETANSYEAGLKTQLLNGQLDLDASVFQMDFRNALTYANDGSGNYVRTNGGQTRFRGFEVETTYELLPALRLSAHYANHDARFASYTLDNGTNVTGNRVEMSPRQLAGIGLLYGNPSGTTASLVATSVGERYLDKSNLVRVGGYTTLDAAVGFRLGRYIVRFSGYNLTDRRDATSASDLHESVTVTGTAGYYRLPGRTALISVNRDL